MDSEGRIIEVVLGTEFSDYDRRTGDNKTRPKNWCRQLALPWKVSIYDSLDRLMNASERTASDSKIWSKILKQIHNQGPWKWVETLAFVSNFHSKVSLNMTIILIHGAMNNIFETCCMSLMQESYESAQRRLLRQLSSYTESLEPYPRLFVPDFIEYNEVTKVRLLTL